jgi:hypothetical protein
MHGSVSLHISLPALALVLLSALSAHLCWPLQLRCWQTIL